ncbi:hypothetical protein [Streptomyces sp. NPDC055400]
MQLDNQWHHEDQEQCDRGEEVAQPQGLREEVAPVSPRVVAAIFMIQYAGVTAGSFFITDLGVFEVLATPRSVRTSGFSNSDSPFHEEPENLLNADR